MSFTIDNTTAKAIYRDPVQVKGLLEQAFGKQFFSEKITDRIKTFLDACESLNISLDWFEQQTQFDSPDEKAYKKMKIIARALNEGWTPNWNDGDECKWHPWFYLDGPSGFRFHVSLYVYTYSYSAGSSRLCFKSRELSDYAAKQFLAIYKDLFN